MDMNPAHLTILTAFLPMTLAAATFTSQGEAELWLADLVSKPQAEVRVAFSPDGQRMLWGAIDWPNGVGGWDIYESHRTANGWSEPTVASFSSSANDFDPSFAMDGSGVYYFSNKPGGFGKDDLYFVSFDSARGVYGEPQNLGAEINTAGDEWAPVVSRDGQRLMFASDGRGGAGKHDLFVARREGDHWTQVDAMVAINSPQEDFDATFLADDRSIVFSRGDLDGQVELFVAEWRDGRLTTPRRLDARINSTQAGAWTFGPSISLSDPHALYFTSRREQHRGRADIYRIRYSLDE